MPTHERNLQANVVRWLNEQPRTEARVNGPGPAHVVGDPDVYGCVKGRMFQIELKTGTEPRKIQEYWLKEWRLAGAHAAVCRNLDEVRDLWHALDALD